MKRTDIKHIDELGKAHISSKKQCSYPILKNYLYFCARIENITSYERYKTISNAVDVIKTVIRSFQRTNLRNLMLSRQLQLLYLQVILYQQLVY